MKTTENAVRDRKGFARLTLVIVLIFAVMGASIWAVSKKTSDDMADAAILNLNENLNLVESTVEAIQDSEAQFQRLLATELAAAGDPAAAVERLGKSDAALNGMRLRFRSVMMTALSFVIGVFPMVFASGAGAGSRQAIGITTFWGMLVATIVGMMFIPGLYAAFQRIAEATVRFFGKKA